MEIELFDKKEKKKKQKKKNKNIIENDII